MALNIITFGQITDVTGSIEFTIEDVKDTNELKDKLVAVYPALKGAKYAIAVDKKIVKENTIIDSKSAIAILPPFSGG